MKSYNIKSMIMTSFIALIMSAGIYTLFAFQGQQEEKTVKTPESENGKESYAILVRQVPHIRASIKTARQMRESGHHHYQTFEVIICGKVVKKLSDGQKVKELKEQVEQLDVRLKACGMSLKKFNVNRESLPEGLDVVPNGMIRMFDLQKKGFKAIEL